MLIDDLFNIKAYLWMELATNPVLTPDCFAQFCQAYYRVANLCQAGCQAG